MAQPTQSKSLLWFLLVGLVALVAVDPGLLNGWHSIRYDLAEGQSITGRLLVLCLSSLNVLLPLLVSSHVVVILYLILLFVMTSIGLSFRLINGQFSLWEASIVLNELDFAGDAISAFSGIILKAIALSALLVAVLFWFRPRRIRSTPGTAAMFAPMILPVAYLLFARGGSAQSNLLLRTGARPDQLPDENGELFAMPNLYQYAKKAGYRPYYLDAQVKGHRLQNFYTQQEMGFLQEYVPLKNHIELPEYNYDLRLADEITKRVADSHENVFIWANKVGTHFPYPKTYPDSDKYPDADKAEHYRHAIHWAVEGFLKRLLPALEALGKPVVVVYTSDHGHGHGHGHGQGLGENDNHSTHCLPRTCAGCAGPRASGTDELWGGRASSRSRRR